MFRIAIVEDQDETRECLNRFVRQYAEEQGVQVEISLITDGSEIAEHYTPGFDIIFMDVEMPRLDGCQAAQAIRALDRPDAKSVFILALTANTAAEDMGSSVKAGMDAHLSKPVPIPVICRTLARLTAKRKSDQAENETKM